VAVIAQASLYRLHLYACRWEITATFDICDVAKGPETAPGLDSFKAVSSGRKATASSAAATIKAGSKVSFVLAVLVLRCPSPLLGLNPTRRCYCRRSSLSTWRRKELHIFAE
jgi:hypothetical protein